MIPIIVVRIISGDVFLAQHIARADEAAIATCVVVAGELLDMAHRSEQAGTNLPRFRAFLEDIALYGVDGTTAAVYGELRAGLFARFGPREKVKRRRFTLSQLGVGENDLWIAAIAIQHDLVVVSADADFARLQQVRPFVVENWLEP